VNSPGGKSACGLVLRESLSAGKLDFDGHSQCCGSGSERILFIYPYPGSVPGCCRIRIRKLL
jgi:hypothetical protein